MPIQWLLLHIVYYKEIQTQNKAYIITSLSKCLMYSLVLFYFFQMSYYCYLPSGDSTWLMTQSVSFLMISDIKYVLWVSEPVFIIVILNIHSTHNRHQLARSDHISSMLHSGIMQASYIMVSHGSMRIIQVLPTYIVLNKTL